MYLICWALFHEKVIFKVIGVPWPKVGDHKPEKCGKNLKIFEVKKCFDLGINF